MIARLASSTAAAATALAAAGLMLAPTLAAAQAYTYQGAPQYDRYGPSYDPDRYAYDDRYDRYGRDSYDYCRSDRNERTGAGVVIGGALGAVAGSQLAARGRRTEGSVLGGVLGAAIGAGVGNDSARDCGRDYDRSPYDYDRYSAYGRTQYGYDQYRDDRAYRYDGYERYGSYDRYGDGYAERYSDYRAGCRTTETTRRTRDGRLITRYEQSCPDRY